MSDWIEWKGGECPVGGGVKVNVKLRGDEPNDPAWRASEKPTNLRWDHRKTTRFAGSGDIIAYRIVKAGV